MFHKVYRAVFLSLFGHKEPNNHIYIEQYAVSSLESSDKHRKQKFAFQPPPPPPPPNPPGLFPCFSYLLFSSFWLKF